MNVDRIFTAFNDQNAEWLLIGGMNIFLNHAPITTLDVDAFILDTDGNRERVCRALVSLNAEWGKTEADWKQVQADPRWLSLSSVFCLTSPHGSIDIFRSVKGLECGYADCRARAVQRQTASNVVYWGLSDTDMLRCQEALPQSEQKLDRIRLLKDAISRSRQNQ
jgi:hypothetical protein